MTALEILRTFLEEKGIKYLLNDENDIDHLELIQYGSVAICPWISIDSETTFWVLCTGSISHLDRKFDLADPSSLRSLDNYLTDLSQRVADDPIRPR